MVDNILKMVKPVFIQRSLKKAYEDTLDKDKIELAQLSTIAGLIILIASIAMDRWALPSALYEVLLARVVIVAVLAFNFIASSYYTGFFLRSYNKILITTFVLISYTIEYSIYLSASTELAYYTYFAPLIVVFMILYSWTYLSIKTLLLITVAIIAGYIFAVLMREEYGPHGATSLIIVTVSILGGATFIGLIGRLIRDKHLHEKFLLQQSFKNLFEEKAKEAKAHEYHANHDALTGLPNRRFAETHLNDAYLSQINQLDMIMVVMFLDLNGFKQINDDYGHDAGDKVLKVIASRLSLCLKDKDYLIRLGGDEFLICLIVENNNEVINSIVNRVRAIISQPIMFEGEKLKVTASIGVARQKIDGNKIKTLIAIADQRMYEEKTSFTINKTNDNVTILPIRA